MDESIQYSVALNVVDMKIANLNMEIIKKFTPELQCKLDKYLNFKKEIYKGNSLIMEEIVKGKENK